MATSSVYLIFEVLDNRHVRAALFDDETERKHIEITPQQHLSEELWNVLPKWISAGMKIDGIGYLQPDERGSYSTVRTLLSVINTLGKVEDIPCARLKEGESISELKAYLLKDPQNEIKAIYS